MKNNRPFLALLAAVALVAIAAVYLASSSAAQPQSLYGSSLSIDTNGDGTAESVLTGSLDVPGSVDAADGFRVNGVEIVDDARAGTFASTLTTGAATSAQFLGSANGTTGAVVFGRSGDENTGIYFGATDDVRIGAGGFLHFRAIAAGVYLYDNGAATGVELTGAAAQESLRFKAGDINGLGNLTLIDLDDNAQTITATTPIFIISGALTSASATSSGPTTASRFVAATGGTTASTAFGPSGDANSGLVFPSADVVQVVAGGAPKFASSSTSTTIADPLGSLAVRVTGDTVESEQVVEIGDVDGVGGLTELVVSDLAGQITATVGANGGLVIDGTSTRIGPATTFGVSASGASLIFRDAEGGAAVTVTGNHSVDGDTLVVVGPSSAAHLTVDESGAEITSNVLFRGSALESNSSIVASTTIEAGDAVTGTRFDASGSSSVSATAFRPQGDANTGLSFPSADVVQLSAGGAPVVYGDASNARLASSTYGFTAGAASGAIVTDSEGEPSIRVTGMHSETDTIIKIGDPDAVGANLNMTFDESGGEIFVSGGLFRVATFESTGAATLGSTLEVSGATTSGSYKIGAISWSAGSGSPESAVSAPIGSLYSRTDGGAGSTLYVKESGTGSTGWAAK